MDTTTVAIPETVQGTIKTLRQATNDTISRLGALEADYVNTKGQLLQQLAQAREELYKLVSETAKENGVDVSQGNWTVDENLATLRKVG
jgi:hypothetical protein